MSRKVILYIAMSLDGYIAGPDEDLSFLASVEQEGEDYGYAEFTAHVDTVIMGRKTYDKVRSFGIPWPHAGRDSYVLSRSRKGADENVQYFDGDIAHLVSELRSQAGQDIYLDGGGEIVAQALQRDLVDQWVISIVPSLLGAGTQLFMPDRPSQMLELERSLTYPSGLVQLWYTRKR